MAHISQTSDCIVWWVINLILPGFEDVEDAPGRLTAEHWSSLYLREQSLMLPDFQSVMGYVTEMLPTVSASKVDGTRVPGFVLLCKQKFFALGCMCLPALVIVCASPAELRHLKAEMLLSRTMRAAQPRYARCSLEIP